MSSPGNTPGSSRPKWLVPLLIGVVVLIALLLLLTQCGGDDDDASAPGTATTAPAAVPSGTATSAAGPAASGQTGEAGTVMTGGEDLMLNLTAAGLKPYDGKQATGNAVEVQSVPADEGFWIGSNETDRLWIQLTDTGGESDYQVKVGDQVGFTGTVTSAADGFAAKSGLTAAEGADQLTEQGHYLSVPASSVKLSR
jgi:hypothetical protein